jgi:hypothetical protein
MGQSLALAVDRKGNDHDQVSHTASVETNVSHRSPIVGLGLISDAGSWGSLISDLAVTSVYQVSRGLDLIEAIRIESNGPRLLIPLRHGRIA